MTKSKSLLTRPELAERLGCDVRTVNKWIAAGMPVAAHGKGGQPSRYDEAAVRGWKRDRDHLARVQSADVNRARARKELAQAVEAEQRVAIRAGRLLPIDDVDRTWSGQVAAVRARLLSWPSALSDRLHRVATLEGAAGVEQLLQAAVYDVLREFATGSAMTTQKKKRTAKKRTRKRPRSMPERQQTC